jgi:hypothetical protein
MGNESEFCASRLYVALAIRMLVKALIASRSKIRKLGLLLTGTEGALIGDHITPFDLLMGDELAPRILKSMKHLEHLHLVLGVEQNPNKKRDEERQWATILPHFVSLFPQISLFTLDFDGTGAWVVSSYPFDCLSKALYLPNLQALDIIHTTCETYSLLQLLRRHQNLKEMYLEIELGYSVQDWHSLIETIWLDSALDKLVINNCSTIGGVHSVQGSYSGYKEDVVITDIFSFEQAMATITC